MMIQAGVVGATGYAGAELCRILSGHPQVELAAISSVSFEGKALSEVYPAYFHMCDLVCGTEEQVVEKSDVIFAALPHGLSQELAAKCWAAGKVFIDLGADFRLESEEEYKEWYENSFTHPELHKEAVYGLPELFREKIQGKKLIANPGCYTTAVPMALTTAMRTPVNTVGIANGNSTIRMRYGLLMPMPRAASFTPGSTCCSPRQVLRTMGRRE